MENKMNDNPKVDLVAGLFNFIRKHWGMLEKLQTFLENNEDFDLKNTCSQLWLEYSAKLGEFSKNRTNDCVEELNAFFYKSAEFFLLFFLSLRLKFFYLKHFLYSYILEDRLTF